MLSSQSSLPLLSLHGLQERTLQQQTRPTVNPQPSSWSHPRTWQSRPTTSWCASSSTSLSHNCGVSCSLAAPTPNRAAGPWRRVWTSSLVHQVTQQVTHRVTHVQASGDTHTHTPGSTHVHITCCITCAYLVTHTCSHQATHTCTYQVSHAPTIVLSCKSSGMQCCMGVASPTGP